MRSLRASAPASLLAAGLLISLAACGTTESPETTPDETDDSGPVTVTDARGEEVVLEDGPATNVVALEWMEAENLVTLGVMPAGVADVSGYGTWVTASPLDDSVTDVGTRQEPSADAIIGLEPDLIILEEDRDPALIGQLEEYAPVLVVKGSDAAGGNIEQMKTNFEMIAQAVGKEDEAKTILGEFDTALADGKAAIEDAGAAGQGFAMADGWTEGSTVNIRMFGKGALFSDIAEELGLQNQWTGEVDPAWGLGQTDVEGLSGLTDLHFFYHQAGEDAWIDGLAGNAIWTALPFVASGKVHPLEPGTWTFGGPASCEQFIDQVVQAVA